MKKLLLIGVVIFYVYSVIAYTPPESDAVNLVLDTGYTAPDNLNVNLVLGDVIADSCTCPSSPARWGIDLADNCEITTDCDVRPYETYCYGTAGGLGIYANLYTRNFTCNFDNVLLNKSGIVWLEKNE